MTAPMNRIKAAIRKTPLFGPLKWLAALLGRSSYPLPFTTTIPAEPFLERAIARIGHAPDPDRREEQFYSYFSEIWDDGYEKTLAQQYAAYLPYLPQNNNSPFLDIGCGAGEFIHFLNMRGISAQGIDSNETEVTRACSRGLKVECADALSYLRAHQEYFSGISLLEVIEHLVPESIALLLSAIFQALAPGGVVLLETINVKHPLAFHGFYTDTTHQRPLPSDLLIFLLQWHGFIDAKIVYTNPLAYSQSQACDPSRAYSTYAIIARKSDEAGPE